MRIKLLECQDYVTRVGLAKSSHDLFNMLPYLGLAMWSTEDSKGNGASTSIALGHAHGRACRPVKVGSLT